MTEDEAYTAIAEGIRALGVVPSDTILTDYVMVVEGSRPDPDSKGSLEYWGLLFHWGQTRRSTAFGLLEIGKELLMNGERVEDDPDPG